VCEFGHHLQRHLPGLGVNAAGASADRRAEEIALLSEKQPMHQFTKPENIGALTVFLASDAAASITGSAYSIDGGWTAA
jgi:3-hydroxybutyrate dehydrogenase